MLPQPPTSTLFPYTTLFRSHIVHHRELDRAHLHHLGAERGHFEHFLERSEEHTSELQSHHDLVCRLLLEKKKIDRKCKRKRNKQNIYRTENSKKRNTAMLY